jgi:outer membrane protein assembly factor BamB
MRENAYGAPGRGFFAIDYSQGTGELVALAAASGKRLWTRPLPSPDFGCVTVANDLVFTATYDGWIYRLRTRDGTILWRARARAGVNACSAVTGSVLLVGAGADHPAFADPRFELIAYALSPRRTAQEAVVRARRQYDLGPWRRRP